LALAALALVVFGAYDSYPVGTWLAPMVILARRISKVVRLTYRVIWTRFETKVKAVACCNISWIRPIRIPLNMLSLSSIKLSHLEILVPLHFHRETLRNACDKHTSFMEKS